MDASPPPEEFSARFERLERRIAELEQWRAAGAAPAPVAYRPDPTQPVPSVTPEAPITPAPPHAALAGVADSKRERWASLNAGVDRAKDGPTVAPPVRLGPGSRRTPAAPSVNWEERIAGRWYVYAGAAVLVMGVVLGLKWAYDVRLLQVSPPVRCIAAAIFGVGLLGAGGEIQKRFNAWAATGCFGAGIGTVYAAAYVGFNLYSLFGPGVALMLLGATSVLGVAVSVRSRLAAVGVLSIVVGFVAPLLLWEHSGPAWALPSYLVALLAMATAVGVLRGGAFRLMRDVALAGTLLIGAGWMIDLPADARIAAWVFLGVTWVIAQAEMVRNALKAPSGFGLPEVNGQDLDSLWRGQTLATSFGVSMWAAGFGYHVALGAGATGDWLAAAACCVSSAGLAHTLAPVSFKAPEDGSKSLGVTQEHWKQVTAWNFWLQAGVLLGITVLILLGGVAEGAAWTGLGAGAVLLARRLRSQPLAFYGAGAFLMLIIRATVSPSWHAGVMDVPAEVLTVKFTWWSVGLIVGAFGATWAMWVRDAFATGLKLAAGVASLGVLVVCVATARDSSHGLGVLFTWIGLATGLVALARRPRGRALGPAACVALALAGVAWLGRFAFDEWADLAWPLMLQPGLLSAVALALAFGPMWRWRRDRACESKVARFMAERGCWASGLILLASTSRFLAHAARVFEVQADARSAMISMWWGVFGFVTVVLGFRWRASPVRFAGLGLMAIGAAKAVLIDLADVSTLWRVVSFLALGALLMTVGVGYQKFEKRLTRQAPGAAGDLPPR